MRHITLSEVLRPWATAGVTHILAEKYEEGSDADASVLSSAPTERGMPALGTQGVHQGNVGVSLQKATVRPTGTAPQQAAQQHQAHERLSMARPGNEQRAPNHINVPAMSATPPTPDESGVQAPLAKNTAAGALAAPASIVPFGQALAQWPAAWQKLYANTRKAPVVWVYEELGFDLTGKGEAARSACLRDIIGRLKFPKGSSSFWPYALPDEGGVLKFEPEIFMYGVQELQPSVIIMAGDEGMRHGILPASIKVPFTQQVFQGKLFILLPPFSRMIDDISLIEKACSYLKTALASIIHLHHI